MKPRKETRYVTRLCVWASSAIGVIEMCRYDSCYPASEADSHKLEQLIHHHHQEPDDHVINLIRVAATNSEPTYGRWRSYNCHVIDVRSADDAPAEYTAAQASAMAQSEQCNVMVRR